MTAPADDLTRWRAMFREGYNIHAIAAAAGVTPATMKRRLSVQLGDRRLLPGTDVHIAGQRGRWTFTGNHGNSPSVGQYGEFRNSRGRTRLWPVDAITTVHRT